MRTGSAEKRYVLQRRMKSLGKGNLSMRLCLRPAPIPLFVIFVVVVSLLSLPLQVKAQGGGPLYTIRQRFGINLVGGFPGIPGFPGRLSDYADIERLGFGWYTDWGRSLSPEHAGGAEYGQIS